MNNKRKSTATPATGGNEDGPSKRRRSTYQNVNTAPTSRDATNTSTAQPSPQRIIRPKRWRRAQDQTNPAPWTQINDVESLMLPRRSSQAIPVQEVVPSSRSTEPANVALRFSFAATPDQATDIPHQDQSLNCSFSGLLVNEKAPSRASRHCSQAKMGANPTVPPSTLLPELSKPKKQREGYGFSYSETFWCDSDEYPDTECEWEGETGQGKPGGGSSSNSNNGQGGRFEAQTPQASFGGSTVVDTDFPVDDYVVIRDVGSYHIAKPQRRLPCTKATREDTIRLKNQAKALLDAYQESSDIQAQLLIRLERMVCVEQQKKNVAAASVTHCALRLRDFLLKIMEERVETGEHKRFVEHEMEWAKWLVEASWTGVMHLKTAGCNCRPDWEEG